MPVMDGKETIKRIRTTTAGDGEAPAAAGSAAANAAELKQRALRQLAFVWST